MTICEFLKSVFCFHRWQFVAVRHIAETDENFVEKVCIKCRARCLEHDFFDYRGFHK